MRMLMAALGVFATTAVVAGSLDALRWQKRLLLVFAQGDDARRNVQEKAIAGGGLAERDLLLVIIPKEGSVEVEGAGMIEAAALRRAYDVADDAPFTVLLVGKDGGVKKRSSEPIAAADLFATIDAMPMRAQEMRGN